MGHSRMRKLEIVCAVVVAAFALVCVFGVVNRPMHPDPRPSGAGRQGASGDAAAGRVHDEPAPAEDRLHLEH